MRLTPKEQDRLTIFTLAEFARRRRARGRKLNAPETIALICDEILEMAWDGLPLQEVESRARSVVRPEEVMEGVPEIIGTIAVDALFPAGTSLVVVEHPLGPPAGGEAAPGAVVPAGGVIRINAGRTPVRIRVENLASVPVEVTSHYHFFESNRLLRFNRRAAYGMRLDAPAGTAVRWEPGEGRDVDLVPLVGTREVWGFHGLVDGPLDGSGPDPALEDAIRRGFEHTEPPDG